MFFSIFWVIKTAILKLSVSVSFGILFFPVSGLLLQINCWWRYNLKQFYIKLYVKVLFQVIHIWPYVKWYKAMPSMWCEKQKNHESFLKNLLRRHWWRSLRKTCPYSELFWSAFPRIQSECKKTWTRITPNTDTSHAVDDFTKSMGNLLFNNSLQL